MENSLHIDWYKIILFRHLYRIPLLQNHYMENQKLPLPLFSLNEIL